MDRSTRLTRDPQRRGPRCATAMALAMLAAAPVWFAAHAKAAGLDFLPQKTRFLDQMIERAVPVGGPALDEARRLRGRAEEAMKAGQDTEADKLLTSALKLLASQSLSAGPSAAVLDAEARRRYGELTEGVGVNREALGEAVRLKGTTLSTVVDATKVDALVAQARQLAEAGKHRQALVPLVEAHGKLEAAVVRLRSNDTVTYSRVFKTPQDELRFEASRFEVNRQLLARAQQAQLPAPQRARLAAVDAEIRTLSDTADTQSKAGNVQAAIRSIEQANGRILDVVMELGRE